MTQRSGDKGATEPATVLLSGEGPRARGAELSALAAPGVTLRALAREEDEAALARAAAAEGAAVLLRDARLDGVRALCQGRSPAVVLLGADPGPERLGELLSAGLAGYLLADTPGPALWRALCQIAAGGSVVSPPLARRLVRLLRPSRPRGGLSPADEPAGAAEPSPLTPRELQVLGLVAGGASNAAVARALGISRSTVRTHLEHIFAKLEVASRTEAVTEALRRGVL